MIKEKAILGSASRILIGDSVVCRFESDQGKISIEEIDLTKQDVILASYHAG